MVEDFFDPNTWVKENSEFRIYADDYANQYAIVDEIDYHYLIQWRWKIKESRKSTGTKDPKKYLMRTFSEIIGEDYKDEEGNRKRQRITTNLFLHTVVAERANLPKPKTKKRLIVDHANGNGFDCRRSNLRWTTISFNNMNRFGSHEKTLFE